MSLQMLLIFGILVFEMVLMTILVMPMPHKIRNAVVNFFYKMLLNLNVRVGLGFGSTVVGMMFFDSLKAAWPHVPNHFHPAGPGAGNPAGGDLPPPIIGGLNYADVKVKKFYAQRNMYITGAVLFLGVAIYFNIMLLKSTVKNKQMLIDLKSAESSEADAGSKSVSIVKFEELKQELKKKELDAESLKKQIQGLHNAYQDKADEVSGFETSVKKSD